MFTSIELLDMVKARYRLDSDRQLARKLGVTPQSISGMRKKPLSFSTDTALVVAELLELDPLKVIASARLEYAQNHRDSKVSQIWEPYAA